MRHLAVLFLTLCTVLASAAPTSAELSELFMPAEFGAPKLSPDGKFLGFIARTGDDYNIGLCDLTTGQTAFSKGDGKARPLDFWWKTSRQVLVQVSNAKLDGLGYTLFDLDRRTTEDAWQLNRQPGRIFDAQPNDPNHVLMLTSDEIRRINLKNGNVDTIDRPPANIHKWVMDSDSRARALYQRNYWFGTANFWWRSEPAGAWKHQHFTAKDRRFIPQAIETDGIHLWGLDVEPGKETTFSRFNTQSGERTNKHFLPGLSPTHLLLLGKTTQPVAVAYAQGKDVALFALAKKDEAAVARLQTTFAGFFPIIVDALPDDKTWLVWIGNSRLPGAYFLFNRQTGAASLLAQSHSPAIAEERLAPAEYFTFDARNGQKLTARVWRPRTHSAPPLIVYCPPQLPAAPTLDVYQAEVQAFVAQGFAVLQVNARGTAGFGVTPDSLGDENWSANLRDDLEDAAASLVKRQIVDPARHFLYGARFGGVLALEIATTSTRFAAIATVNIPSKISREDLFVSTDDSGINGMTTRLGGWAETGRLARDLSPLRQVKDLKIPALYLHDEDSIKAQPNQDGREIRASVKKSGNARTGLAYSWSDRIKAPSKLASENASVSLQVGLFFSQLGTSATGTQARP